jgi:hypothetical protein
MLLLLLPLSLSLVVAVVVKMNTSATHRKDAAAKGLKLTAPK